MEDVSKKEMIESMIKGQLVFGKLETEEDISQLADSILISLTLYGNS
jgi:hypothetical protein